MDRAAFADFVVAEFRQLDPDQRRRLEATLWALTEPRRRALMDRQQHELDELLTRLQAAEAGLAGARYTRDRLAREVARLRHRQAEERMAAGLRGAPVLPLRHIGGLAG